MKFTEAMSHLTNGENIRRKCWDDKTYFLSKEKTGIYQFTPGDIDATDWEIYREPLPIELEEMTFFVWDDLGFGSDSQSRFYDRTRIKSYDELVYITLNHCLNNDPTIYKEIMEFIRDRYNRNSNE